MAIAGALSTLGLLLMGGLCAAISILLCHAWNPCNIVAMPDIAGLLTIEDCEGILQGAATGAANPTAAGNLIFALSLAARIEGCFFVGTAVGCLYALTLPLYARHVLLLPLAVFATLCACVDGNSAGIGNPFVTPMGEATGLPLMCLWGAIALCLWAGFLGSERQDPRFNKLLRTLQAAQGSKAKAAKSTSAKKARKAE